MGGAPADESSGLRAEGDSSDDEAAWGSVSAVPAGDGAMVQELADVPEAVKGVPGINREGGEVLVAAGTRPVEGEIEEELEETVDVVGGFQAAKEREVDDEVEAEMGDEMDEEDELQDVASEGMGDEELVPEAKAEEGEFEAESEEEDTILAASSAATFFAAPAGIPSKETGKAEDEDNWTPHPAAVRAAPVSTELESTSAPSAASASAEAADADAASGILSLLSIRLHQQELGAAEKAILSKGGVQALVAAFEAIQAAQGKGVEAMPCRVVGMYGSKASMLSVLARNGVGVSKGKMDSLEAAPGIYGVLLNGGAQFPIPQGSETAGSDGLSGNDSPENGEDCGGNASGVRGKAGCAEPVLCIFFWHPDKVLPQEARSSVCCSFVRYIADMADEVLVLLEEGDPATLATGATGARNKRPVRRSQRGRVALRQVSEDSAEIFPGMSVAAKHPSDPGLVPRLSGVASRRGAVLFQRTFGPQRQTKEQRINRRRGDVRGLFASLKACHVVSWGSLCFQGRSTLLQLLDPGALVGAQEEGVTLRRTKEGILEEEKRELKERLVTGTSGLLERVATHFLLECYPEGERALQKHTVGAFAGGEEGAEKGAGTGGKAAVGERRAESEGAGDRSEALPSEGSDVASAKEKDVAEAESGVRACTGLPASAQALHPHGNVDPLEYSKACLQLAALWGPGKQSRLAGQAGKEVAFLHARTRVKLQLGVSFWETRDIAKFLGLSYPETEVAFSPSPKQGYGGPIFYGQSVYIAVLKPSGRMVTRGPVLVYPASGRAFGPVRLGVPIQLVRIPSEVTRHSSGILLQACSAGPAVLPLRNWLARTAKGVGFPKAFLSSPAAAAGAVAAEEEKAFEAEGATTEDKKSATPWPLKPFASIMHLIIGRNSPEGAAEIQESSSEMDWEGGCRLPTPLRAEVTDSPGTASGNAEAAREQARGSQAQVAEGEEGMEEGRVGELVKAWELEQYTEARCRFLALLRQQMGPETVVGLAELRALYVWGCKTKKVAEEQDSFMHGAVDMQLRRVFEALPAAPPSDTQSAQSGSKQDGRDRGCVAPHLQAEVLDCKIDSWSPDLVSLQLTWEQELPQQHQWEMREVTCHRRDLDALMAPRAAKAQAPLPIQPLLLEPKPVLKGLGRDSTLEHCFLLGSGETLSLVSEAAPDGPYRGVRIFLGSKEVGHFPRGGHSMAFDETSRLLALFAKDLGKVQVYRMDETFKKFDWTGADIEMVDTGSCDVKWMAFVPGSQQLLVVEGQRVRAFEISQSGMVRPRDILLPAPFGGKACVSPDGSCLLVLSPTPPLSPNSPSGDASAVPASPAPTPPLSPNNPCDDASATPPRPPPTPPLSPNNPSGDASAVPPSPPSAQPAVADVPRAETSGRSIPPEGGGGGAIPVCLNTENVRAACGELQLEVYLLETMRPLCTLPLPGITGPTADWDLGLVFFGKQANLALLHRPTGNLTLKILSITTSRQTCEVEDVEGGRGAATESAGAATRPGAPASPSPARCAALEALYHSFDKFATSPFLAETQRALTVHLVPPPRNAAAKAPGAQGLGGTDGEGTEGVEEKDGVLENVLIRAVHNIHRRLEVESAKDFSKLNLTATCQGPPGSLDLVAGPGTAGGAGPGGWGKGVPWQAWVRRLKCLVPVQIARAQGNSLRLLRDGLQMAQDCDYTDAVSLSLLLSFGPYDEILSAWGGPIKVVSSMGKQSSGKSYLLNHLSGALLDISGGRCTDGVWLTVREAGGCLYVLLDFEGLGSFERTEQEDMLLSLLNAAISSLTIFNKKDFHFDKEMESVFSRFQSGVNVLNADKRLFQGLFYIAIKDVAENDVESVQAEFREKITRICEGNNDNFLLRMYNGGFEVGAMAPFHEPEYQESVADLGYTLEDLSPAYKGGRAFLRDLKLVLAQISTKDWSPLDVHRVALRTGILRRQLPHALRLGCTAEPGPGLRTWGLEGASEGVLVNLDTGEAVGEEEGREREGGGQKAGVEGKEEQPEEAATMVKAEAGGSGEGGSAPAKPEPAGAQALEVGVAAALARACDAGLELPVGEDKDSTASECLARLRALYGGAMSRRACADSEWHSGFEAFVERVAGRRGRRVLRWLQANTQEFGESGDVKKLLAEAREAVAEMRGALGVCASQCDQCYFRCVLKRGHKDGHSCEDSHVCNAECTFCLDDVQGAMGAPAGSSKEDPFKDVSGGAGAVMGCVDKAGHGGSHDCGVRAHTCRHSCRHKGLASNCNGVCSRKASHEGEHLCNSAQHMCLDPCSLPGCSHTCTLPYDFPHTRHQCHDRMCPEPCAVKSCNRSCGEKDHFHSFKFKWVTGAHFCGQAHPCQELCERDGICEVKTEILNKKEVFRGARGDFEYERVSEQTGVTKPCCKLIPPGCLSHSGPHCHSEDPLVHHFCDARCPLCEYICTRPHAHEWLHSTSHGSMKHAHFVAEARDIDVGGRMYVWGEEGVAEMCMMHCKQQGRGHVHLALCKAGSGGACAGRLLDGSRHETRKYGPDFDVPKDEFTHQAFWASCRFKDPCPREEQEEFELCGHYCSSKEHDRNLLTAGPSTAAAPPERQYCKEKMWHSQLAASEEQPVASGYISTDGHWFPCQHVPKGRYHVIFVVDRSGSMAGSDAVPQTAAFQSQHNRLGCVYESIVRFIRTRAAALQGSPNQDVMSVILFNDRVATPVEARKMEEGLMRRVSSHGPWGGTMYLKGIQEALRVLTSAATNANLAGKRPVLLFLSDGDDGGSDPLGVCRQMRLQFPQLVIHAIKFGRCPKSKRLQQVAAAGNGQFSVSLDEVQLATAFESLAKSLCSPVSSLMAGGKR